MKEQTIGSGDEASLTIGTLLGNTEGLIYRGLWGKGVEESTGDGRLSFMGPVGESGVSADWEF